MVGQKKLVNVLLPEELYQALVCYQQQQGLAEVKEACAEILAQFFHKDSGFKRYATVEQLVALEEKVTHLSEQVALLNPKKAGSTNPEAARTASALGNEHTRPTLSAQLPKVALVSTSLEEEYEEPDEILYDFLEPGSSPY
jgi:hypothetical protein